MNTLSSYLKAISFYPPELDKTVWSIVEPVPYKTEFLCKPGRICPHIWYLQTGIVRIFEERGDKEITSWIQGPHSIIIAPDSSLGGRVATRMFIQPLEPCLTQRATMQDVHRVMKEHPDFEKHYRIINENYRRLQSEREADLRALGPEERFLKQLKENPSFFHRVPNDILMEYLHISHNKFAQYKSKYRV